MGKSWAIDDRAQLQGDANRAITAQLAPDETVRVIIRGIQGSAIIGTDRRAFVFKKVLWNTDMSSWDYSGISGVEFNDKGPLLPGFVRIRSVGAESKKMAHTSDSALQIAFNDKGHASKATAELRRLVSAHQTPASVVSPTQATGDIADQIRKLVALRDEGILTPEEFDAQKQKLLDA